MLTPEYLLGLAEPNAELQKIIAANGPAPQLGGLTEADIPALRERLQGAKEQWNSANDQGGEAWFVEKDILLPMRDGARIAARVHSPKTPPADGSPLFVIFHGGGFVLGGLENESTLCREWARLGGVALNVDYRLAPEYKFPYAVNDAEDALKWAGKNFDELKANPEKGFLVGGISAGGNLSAVVSHLYINEKLSPPLTGLWLSIPVVMSPQNIEVVPAKYKPLYLAMKQNLHAPVLNEISMAFFDKMYASDPLSPLRSPILFPSHAGMPPTYFQICGQDPLRDDAFIYEEILREEYGVKTKVHVYPGLPHGFWSAFPTGSFCDGFRKDCVEALEWFAGGCK